MKEHYKKLRRFLGVMGFALPILLALSSIPCRQVQNSISAYYYTYFIWLFCGILLAIGLFLITYDGYTFNFRGYTFKDKWITKFAGIMSIGIAIFPTAKPSNIQSTCHSGIETYWEGANTLHLICAAFFFIATAFISAFLFTQTYSKEDRVKRKKKTSNQKIARNWIYYLCGGLIAFGMLFLIAVGLMKHLDITDISASSPRYIFYTETVMLFAFGTSWLVKGETLFTDDSRLYKRVVPDFLKEKFRKRARMYNEGEI